MRELDNAIKDGDLVAFNAAVDLITSDKEPDLGDLVAKAA